METNKYILQGGGEHARVVLDCLKSQDVDVLALFDPKYEGSLMGVPQMGIYQSEFSPQALAIVAIGDNKTRRQVVNSTKHSFGIAIHPSAILSPYAVVGKGTMILQGAIVQALTRVGEHVIFNTGCRVDHDNVIGNFVHVGPGAILCGMVKVGEGAFIGAGATVIQGIRIGAWAVIGAGAVVIRDVPDHAVVVGNPGRIIQSKTA